METDKKVRRGARGDFVGRAIAIPGSTSRVEGLFDGILAVDRLNFLEW